MSKNIDESLLTAQQKANRRQEAKRTREPRFNLRMTENEEKLLNAMAEKTGSKKSAVMQGLVLLKKSFSTK